MFAAVGWERAVTRGTANLFVNGGAGGCAFMSEVRWTALAWQLFLVRAEQSSSAVLLGDWMGIVSSRWQWAALSLWFLVLKECHAQELLNMGIQTGVMRTSAL